MNRFPIIPAALALLLCFGVVPAYAQDEIRSERVQFKKGAASAVIKGRLKGYTSVDYLVRAGAGSRHRHRRDPPGRLRDAPHPVCERQTGRVGFTFPSHVLAAGGCHHRHLRHRRAL